MSLSYRLQVFVDHYGGWHPLRALPQMPEANTAVLPAGPWTQPGAPMETCTSQRRVSPSRRPLKTFGGLFQLALRAQLGRLVDALTGQRTGTISTEKHRQWSGSNRKRQQHSKTVNLTRHRDPPTNYHLQTGVLPGQQWMEFGMCGFVCVCVLIVC